MTRHFAPGETQFRDAPLGETGSDRLEILQHTRTSPIDARAVFEADEHIRIARHGLGTYSLDVRSRERRGHDRVTVVMMRSWAQPIELHRSIPEYQPCLV